MFNTRKYNLKQVFSKMFISLLIAACFHYKTNSGNISGLTSIMKYYIYKMYKLLNRITNTWSSLDCSKYKYTLSTDLW